MAETKIEWADYTANAHRGCSKVHAGCQQCYAETLANRFPATFGRWGTEKQGGIRVVADLDKLFKDVKRWNRWDHKCMNCGHLCFHEGAHPDEVRSRCCNANAVPARPIVFWNDVSDTFEDWQGPLVDRHGVQLINCPNCGIEPMGGNEPPLPKGCSDEPLTLSDVRRRMFAEGIDANQNLTHVLLTKRPENARGMWPNGHSVLNPADAYRKNCWLLYSASDQATLEAGLLHLLECRDLVPVIGLSLEPLTGPVDLWYSLTRKDVDWVIVGGESGPDARPCDVEWIRSIVEQCVIAGVPCFVKQDSGPKSGLQGRISDDLWKVKDFPTGDAGEGTG